mgnify:CR=1 FL=1
MYLTERKNPLEKIILGSFTHAQHRDRDTEDFIIVSASCTPYRHKLSGCHYFCSPSDCFSTDPHSGPGCSQSPASVFTLKCSARPRVELTRSFCLVVMRHFISRSIAQHIWNNPQRKIPNLTHKSALYCTVMYGTPGVSRHTLECVETNRVTVRYAPG